MEGLRVLVTGATGGIGQAIAEAFHKEGAFICASGRNKKILTSLQARYRERYSIWPFDLSAVQHIPQFVQDIEEREGSIDILINNGGITRDGLCFRMKDEAWEEVLQVNLTAPFYLAREIVRGMMKRKQGRIINIASIVGLIGNPGQANYSAAKAGMLGWTKTMAQEVARWGITVNAIAPGYIETAMTQGLGEGIKDRIPCQRLGSPEDIAYGALFLASPKSSYITGQTLHINGGMNCF